MKNLLIVALIGWAGYSAYTLYVEHPAEFAQKKKARSDLAPPFRRTARRRPRTNFGQNGRLTSNT